ncbi:MULTISPECIES: 50S ribosomal protein L25/general stress protein Ctc [Actinomyces]|uniref:Large ribosomal subunit protein bL25 n=1 Tax=Actinomyces respiraculi TaxID=2744574 RepID=A0A7T0PXA8_9ACTO|nr:MULTISPECIES: 50S ribosomal protein L25/general stress protein Ctc [Actinomyces]QPL05675.1 50S ribosomal protein L25/general stress protein Ctc [Actinomyces respiraculi]
MAHNAISLKATVRTSFGKGSARQARRDGLVPVVVYGHGTEPRHLLLDEHTARLALRGNDNALVELDVDGDKILALAKDVQRHPIRPGVQHVDFLVVNRNERVEVEVPVVLAGDAAPGALPMIEAAHIVVSAPAVEIPESIEVDVTGVAPGTVITVADLTLPAHVEAVTDAETGVVNVADEAAVASEAPEAEAEAPAEGE